MTWGEYVLNLYNDVRMLDDMPSVSQIIDKFSRHFDEHIKAAILARGINKIDRLIKLLDTSDQIGDLNSYRAAQTAVVKYHPDIKGKGTYPLMVHLGQGRFAHQRPDQTTIIIPI